jgi:ABC-type glycerol-3-phosphate transport system substrate-binding protein
MSRFSRTRWLYLAGLAVVLLLAGCDQIPIPGINPAASPTATEAPQQPTVTTAVQESPSPQASASPTTLILRLWLPPEFDPYQDTPAGELLLEQLEEYQARRPNVKIEVRIKPIDGPGGIINTLTTASAAAPLALPDVVALPRRSVEPAVQKGLLYPISDPGLSGQFEWFDYVTSPEEPEQDEYALPFAGDALALLYRPELVATPPALWSDVQQLQFPLLFAAAEPQASFTLTQYRASGGQVEDSDGRPYLDRDTLTGVYIFYRRSSDGEQMPFWLTQYEDDDQVWEDYLDGRSPLAVTWISHYLLDQPDDTAVEQLPTESGAPYSLATGWVWALTHPDASRREAGTELALFLSDAEFLGQWTMAAGYLPTRPEVLATWSDPALQSVAERVIASAHPGPPPDTLSILGPALQESTIAVLKQQDTPASAAAQAAEAVNTPGGSP